MRKLGVLAPLDGPAFAYYVRVLNAEVKRRLGSEHTAQFMAVGFSDGDNLMSEEKWWTLTQRLRAYIRDLGRAGMEGTLMCPVTWYRLYDDLVEGLPVLLFHPVDALEREMSRRGVADTDPIGLLLPRLAVFPGSLLDRFAGPKARRVIVPPEADCLLLERISECASAAALEGPRLRHDVLRVTRALRAAGARSIVVGSAELANLLQPEDYAEDCYDLARIHATAAVDWMFDRTPEVRPPV